MTKEKKKKLPIGITEDFVAEIESASPENLKALIVDIQGDIAEVNAFLKGDVENLPEAQVKGAEELQDLKNAYDEAAAPSRETIRALRNRTKFVIETLKKSGAL